jgi:hypothetical protein
MQQLDKRSIIAQSVDDSWRVATYTSWRKPWTRFGIALTTGRIAVGLDGPKVGIQVTGK